MADIFVSYTSSDREWAHWIGAELATLGRHAHVHEWEIEGGADILARMEKHLESADHVLCVVSDEYLRAPYSTLECNAALWRATKQRPTFALFVVVKPCKLPALVDHLKRCELFGLSEDARREKFRAYMRDPAPPEGGLTVPTQVFALSNIPIRVPEHFLGRDDALAAVDAALKRHDGRVAITTLHGLRGVGKTTLAAAYADLHRTEYRATWWIRAQTDSTMPADLVALGVQLGWVAADEKEEPALTKVRERLRHEGEGLLLIYDNAIDAESREELPTERFLWSRSSWYDNPSYLRPNHGQRQGGDHARSGNSGAGGQPRFAASFSQPQSRHPNRASGKARARGRRAVGGGMRQARRDRREGFG